jgi:hypothetical protein
VKLPPYQEMPPEVRMRLRQRVLPRLRAGTSPRVPYLVAAAVVILAVVSIALLLSPARDAAPPAGPVPIGNPDLQAYKRLSTECGADTGTWRPGAYLLRHNGDGVQLATKPMDDILGFCSISSGRPATWFQTTVQRPPYGAGAYQAVRDNGLVYGVLGIPVASVTVNGVLAVVYQDTFIAEVDSSGPVTLVARDTQGHVLAQGTIN